MVKEWESCWNSFNSYKGLMYIEHYRAILRGEFLPPIECSVDPVNMCNLRCQWCNSKEVYKRNVMMDGKHLLELVEFFKSWKIKGLCFAGGGEPTLHPQMTDAVNLLGKIGLPVAIISNGTYIDKPLGEALANNCRWIGISVDAGTADTYLLNKGVDLFDTVIENIKRLTKLGAREVMYKFLLHPSNQHEVYKAIELAHDCGCQGIHIRPISFLSFQEEEEDYNEELINEQVMRGRAIFEDEKFKVFYIQHKFDKSLHRKINFKKCLATPIMPIFQANGDISICIDRKADPSLVIGSHLDISKIKDIWGSNKHKEVINKVKLFECPKCTINYANEQIEQAVILNKCDYEFV